MIRERLFLRSPGPSCCVVLCIAARRRPALRNRPEYFHPDGTPLLRTRRQGQGEHRMRYWPSGAINTESMTDRDGRERYLRCLEAGGRDVAPGGTGKLLEILGLDAEMRQWQEGELVGGLLTGEVRRMASYPDGAALRETGRCFFRKGRAQ